MSATHRRREGYLLVVLLAAVFVLVPRTGAAMRGMGGQSPPFALGGAGTFGSTFARGAFTSRGIAPRFGGHRFAHRRHGNRGFSYAYGGFPYYDYGYDPYYADRPASSSEGEAPRRYQHSGYCDVSGKYPQDCVWKDGP